MKVYTREDFDRMPADDLEDVFLAMGGSASGMQHVASQPPNREAAVGPDDDIEVVQLDEQFVVDLADPTVRQTVVNLVNCYGICHKPVPDERFIILDVYGDDSRRKLWASDLGVVAYTLDEYKQECRDRTEKMRSDLLERLAELDASRAEEISEALGDAESFITKRLVEDGGTPTETI